MKKQEKITLITRMMALLGVRDSTTGSPSAWLIMIDDSMSEPDVYDALSPAIDGMLLIHLPFRRA
jgi:hypothetical protein